MADRVGQRLGNYRLIRLLGRGGFAEVYLGEHLRLGAYAAIKVLYTRLVNPDDVESFEKEARTIAHLKHSHIVRVFDYDIEDDTPFLVMDYAVGGTLRKRHPRGTVLPLTTIVSYVKQTADALQYAHNQHVIHRDIKPENILVGERDELLLSDFGIAVVAQSSRYESTQNMVGTMAYMAPEQIQGHPFPASDQYSLGNIVYEWLSGDRPFQGSMTEIVAQHLAVPPPSLREKVVTISSDVEQVVMTALAKDPKQRFASVRAFANALEQASRNPADITLPVNLPSHFPNMITVQSQPQQSTKHAIPLSQIAGPITAASSPSQTSYLPHEVTSLGKPTRSKWGISRRKVMIGLIGLACLAGTGGVVWSLLFPKPLPPKLLPSKPLPPKPLYEYDGHSSTVRDVVWSPHGGRIASASDDGTVQVWDATTGGNVFTYRDQSMGVYRIDWSPDGTRIASGGNDNTVQVWDATTGNHVSIYHGHSTYYPAIYELAWSSDGKYIASVDNFETVHIWHADTGNDVFIYRANGQVWTGVWSPNSKYIAFANSGNTFANTGGTVEVVDTGNWSTVYIYRGHSSSLAYGHSVTWAPDSMRIASADDNEMHIWDATNGHNVSICRGKFDYAIKWSPDGKFIASIAGRPDYTVEVWQLM